MRRDLADDQWGAPEHGQLTGPDGRRYVRRTTRARRRDVDDLLAGGAPLVLSYWAGRQLEWFDGADAAEQWRAVRGRVVSAEPRPTGDVEWTAGRWEDDDGRPLVLLTGHC